MEKMSVWKRIDRMGSGPIALMMVGCAVSLTLSAAALRFSGFDGGTGLTLAAAALRAVLLPCSVALGWDLWQQRETDP